MLSTEEFRGFAKGVVPFLHVTSRLEGEKYGNLLSEKGGQGFPHLVAMDAEGEVIGVVSGERSVAGFTRLMKDAADYSTLRGKKGRSPAEEVRLLGFELGMDRVTEADARTRAAALKDLDADPKKALDALLLGLDIQAELKLIKGPDPALRIAAGKDFAAMWKEGRRPGSDDGVFQPFFIYMLDYAESEKDAAHFEKALGVLREKFGSEPKAAGFFKKQDERLAKLKAPAPVPPVEGGEKK